MKRQLVIERYPMTPLCVSLAGTERPCYMQYSTNVEDGEVDEENKLKAQSMEPDIMVPCTGADS